MSSTFSRREKAASIVATFQDAYEDILKLLRTADDLFNGLSHVNAENPLKTVYELKRRMLRTDAALMVTEFRDSGARPVFEIRQILSAMTENEDFGSTQAQARQFQVLAAALTPLAELTLFVLASHMVGYHWWTNTFSIDQLRRLYTTLESLRSRVLDYTHPSHDRLVNTSAV